MMTSKTFLSRGHLASAKDFLMGAWQSSSYIYINLIPQWQSINTGHWYKLEKAIRRLANLLQDDFIIVTGTHGVMSGINYNKEKTNLYLDPERKILPVPETLWKIVVNPINSSCIVFLMSNNPFEENPPNHLCDNVCDKFFWPKFFIYNWRGYMYCCTYRSFKKVIKYAPEFNCKRVLRNIPESDDPFQPI
uniref:DNA/RNA non-specific endonuclease/pyrophosphatase/phosphodiesterase domain-containing protein n=1 Tax=Clastoptera arizonana TaxID=38151 RepID=A0A1B6CX44_9HEMI